MERQEQIDAFLIQLGLEIAKLRTAKKMSRSRVASRATSELETGSRSKRRKTIKGDSDDEDGDIVTERYLARLENGKVKKQPGRYIIDAILKALKCDERQRARILLYADRNVLIISDTEPTIIEEMVNYVSLVAITRIRELTVGTATTKLQFPLNEQEVWDIIKEIALLEIAKIKRSKK